MKTFATLLTSEQDIAFTAYLVCEFSARML